MNGQGRPTALTRRIDLSASGQRASGAPASPERALEYAYRHSTGADVSISGLEQRPCVCGGTVTADPLSPAKGVQAHNYSPRHKAWRSNHEQELYAA